MSEKNGEALLIVNGICYTILPMPDQYPIPPLRSASYKRASFLKKTMDMTDCLPNLPCYPFPC